MRLLLVRRAERRPLLLVFTLWVARDVGWLPLNLAAWLVKAGRNVEDATQDELAMWGVPAPQGCQC
jgi:hypothetical protein